MLNNVHNALLQRPEARTLRFPGVVRSINIRITALSLPLGAPSIIYSIG
jgi:hypothetical protein